MSINPSPSAASANRPIAIWLFAMCALVALMVIVGGATRLTDSGLSITEWAPISGALPPLSEARWEEELEKYRAIPEYQQVNYGMSMAEFKFIYWWEWGHRLLGRIIGVAFFIPMVVFMIRREVNRSLGIKLIGLFFLGGLQGLMGWYMVQSGLTERIDVSQYRLAAHLGLAIILFGAMFWLALSLWPRQIAIAAPKGLALGAQLLCLAIFVQIILGAFVAGLRAGKTFNSWPLMDGRFFPDGYFRTPAQFVDLFETMAAVQFNHRLGAYVLAGLALWFYVAARKTPAKIYAQMILAALTLQMVIGIWTVVAAVPIALGLIHQAGALILLGVALLTAQRLRTS